MEVCKGRYRVLLMILIKFQFISIGKLYLLLSRFSRHDVGKPVILLPLLEIYHHFFALLLLLPHHLQFLHIIVIDLLLIVCLGRKVSPLYKNNCKNDDGTADTAHQNNAQRPISSEKQHKSDGMDDNSNQSDGKVNPVEPINEARFQS